MYTHNVKMYACMYTHIYIYIYMHILYQYIWVQRLGHFRQSMPDSTSFPPQVFNRPISTSSDSIRESDVSKRTHC